VIESKIVSELLKRSAFTDRIYRGLPMDVYFPGISMTEKTLGILAKRENLVIKPKRYQVHDSFLMFYQPIDVVLRSLKNVANPTLWQRIVSSAVKSEEFTKISKVTVGSQDLAALAGARFIHYLVKEVGNYLRYQARNNPQNKALHQLVSMPVERVLNMSDQRLRRKLGASGASQQDVQQAMQVLQEILVPATVAAIEATLQDASTYAELKQSGMDAVQMIAGSGGFGFSHDALSIWTFLRDPDEFRRRVRLLRSTIDMFRKFMSVLPTSLQHQQTVSVWGGISGVDRMLRESQLKDVLPSELASLAVEDEKLREILKLDFLLRLAQKQVMVYQRSATLKPVIFIDKSGSMAEPMPGTGIPKISMACGLALAIWMKYRGDVYFFDTELEKASRSRVVQLLLTIRADGGTRIEEALKEVIRRGRKDEVYVIISDGIDIVDDEIIEELKRLGLVKNVRFILVPPSQEAPWLKNFRYWYARDVAQFINAVRAVL